MGAASAARLYVFPLAAVTMVVVVVVDEIDGVTVVLVIEVVLSSPRS